METMQVVKTNFQTFLDKFQIIINSNKLRLMQPIAQMKHLINTTNRVMKMFKVLLRKLLRNLKNSKIKLTKP
nr:MAG TPA: hypothetical protein [Caudoviricetes sp.]